MEQTIEQKNKALVLEAFDTLFNRKDFSARCGRVASISTTLRVRHLGDRTECD